MIEDRFDLIVIGAGIIGLSTAMACRRRFPQLRLLVLEKEPQVGLHQSRHNSGVIHSGVYYRPGSLKAKLCVEGARAMIQFCQEHGISHALCGKLIVATSEPELEGLNELYGRGTANRVPGLSLLSSEQLREIEPHAAGIRALCVPGTGITDYGAVTEKMAAIVAQSGGEIQTGARVLGLIHRDARVLVETTKGAFSTRYTVNCAGLHSDRIAKMSGAQTDLLIVPFRGEYYDLVPERQHLVKGLIYPVPDPDLPFLGVHFTKKIRGGVEAGPNAVLAFKREGYRKTDFNLTDTLTTLMSTGFWRMAQKYWRSGLDEFGRSLSKKRFLRALQRLVPDLCEKDLISGASGVRAQAVDRTGALLDDFHFARSGTILHVCNVPSPAATCSLLIGQRIVEMMEETIGING